MTKGTVSVAIVGAGMAGLSCATALRDAGLGVALFDKGRRPAGRMASVTVDHDGARFAFDYGVQYFTVRDAGFAGAVDRWTEGGHAARWPAAGTDAWVGTPDMAAPLAALAASLDVAWSHHVVALVRRDAGWFVRYTHGEAHGEAGPFATLVLALPAEQAAALAGAHDFALAQTAAGARSDPCWTVMLGFAAPLAGVPDVPAPIAPIDWAARQSAKPGRPHDEAWVIHADTAWSRAHLEAEPDTVAAALVAEFARQTGQDIVPVYTRVHRWRFARSARAGTDAYFDAASGLGACGDWLIAPRVESAWLSGTRLAERVVVAHAAAVPSPSGNPAAPA